MPTARLICIVLFWIWGIFGLLANLSIFMSINGTVSVATAAFWIGGMILFGLGSLTLASEPAEAKRASEHGQKVERYVTVDGITIAVPAILPNSMGYMIALPEGPAYVLPSDYSVIHSLLTSNDQTQIRAGYNRLRAVRETG